MSSTLVFCCKKHAIEHARKELAIEFFEGVKDMPLEDFIESYRSLNGVQDNIAISMDELIAFRERRVQQVFDGLASNESFLLDFLRGNWSL